MSREQRDFLSLPRYPLLLELLQVGWLLGLTLREVKILVRRKVIPTAGKKKRRKSQKCSTPVILELVDDPAFPDLIKDALSIHWEKENARKCAAITK